MRTFTKKQMKRVLDATSTAIENSRKNPTVMELIGDFGYTEEALQAAGELRKKAEELYLGKGPKTGKKISINIQLREKINQIHRLFMVYEKMVRRDLKVNPALFREFDLSGGRDYTFSGKIKEAKGFYENLLKNEEIASFVLKYGLAQEKIQSHLTAIADIEKSRQYKALVIKESEKATQERDEVFQQLNDWWLNYKTVLIHVFTDDPQQLEAFEIKAYTPGYAPHKKNEPEKEEVEPPGVQAIAATSS